MLKLNNTSLLLPEKKVIKAQEYSAIVTAEQIIQNALEDAENIKKEALQIYESERKRGFQEGFASGKDQISEYMLDLAAKSVENFSKFEQDMVSLVTNALKRIVGEMDQKELITHVVKNSIKMIRNQKQATLRVSPIDAQAVRDNLGSILSDTAGVSFLDIVPDSRLTKGSCILETELGVIDASIDTQLDAIKRSISKAIL